MAWTEQIGPRSWRVRYPTGDGHTASVSGFTTKHAADDHAHDIETDQRRGNPINPAHGRTTVTEWVTTRFATLDLDPRTLDNYRSILRCHILPRWGGTPLRDITTLAVNNRIADLHRLGYATSTNE